MFCAGSCGMCYTLFIATVNLLCMRATEPVWTVWMTCQRLIKYFAPLHPDLTDHLKRVHVKQSMHASHLLLHSTFAGTKLIAAFIILKKGKYSIYEAPVF